MVVAVADMMHVVRKLFDLLELLGRYRLEVGEVEAQAIGANVAARLLHMGAQNLAQCSVQDMGGRCGCARCERDACRLSTEAVTSSPTETVPSFNLHHMAYQALFGSLRVGYLKL